MHVGMYVRTITGKRGRTPITNHAGRGTFPKNIEGDGELKQNTHKTRFWGFHARGCVVHDAMDEGLRWWWTCPFRKRSEGERRDGLEVELVGK